MTEFKPDRQTPPSAAAHHLPPQAGSAELDAIFAVARTLTLPAQQPVFHPGSPCRQYLLVTAGRVCVYLSAENGREVTLYHVEPGHSCVLTTSCLLGGELYPAAAVTETEVTALAIDAQTFAHSLDNSAEFRRFVFTNLSRRLADVIRRMEEVTFGAIDQRLAAALLACRSAAGNDLLHITHQTLAMELGTAREVISRHLKRFEARGWLRLGRGTIELVDMTRLGRLSQLTG